MVGAKRCLLIALAVPALTAGWYGSVHAQTTAVEVTNADAPRLLAQVQQARDSGDEALERALLTQAVQAVGEYNTAAYPLYDRLRALHADAGEFSQSIAIAHRQLTLAGGPAQRVSPLVSLVSHYATLHQFPAARAALAELEQVMTRLRKHPRWPMQGDWWQAGLAKAKASLATHSGQLEQAGAAWQACLTSANAAAALNPTRENSALWVDCSRGLIGVLLSTGQLAAAGQAADALRVASERAIERSQRAGIAIRVDQLLGRLALEQGQLDLASRLLLRTLDSLDAVGAGASSLRMAASYTLLAQLAMLRQDWVRALDWHHKREQLLGQMTTQRGDVGSLNPEYAYTLLRLGQNAEALTMLRKVTAARDRLYEPDSLYALESHAFLGLALHASGAPDEALREMQRALPKMLALMRSERSSSESGALRTARLNWLLEGYIALLAEHAGSPDTAVGKTAGDTELSRRSMDEAFRMADLARGSTVQRALAAATARARIDDPELATLARREQDLQREASALAEALGNLLARGRIAEEDKVVTDMRSTLADLRREHSAALAEIEHRFPDYAALLNPQPVGLAAVQALLKPGEALLSFYPLREYTLVWAIPAQGAPAFARVDLPAEQLAQQVATLRAALDPSVDVVSALPAFPFALSHALYQRLLVPVASGWQDARELIVVAQGSLAQLPLGVLTTAPFQPRTGGLINASLRDAPWLIKRVAVAQLPTVMALPALRAASSHPPAPRAFAGFGDPQFGIASGASAGVSKATRGIIRRRSRLPATASEASPGALAPSVNFALLPPLPDTALEVRDIANALAADPTRDLFLQRRASEAVLKQAPLADYRVLMFATHGLTSNDMPGLYQPALALSNPALTGDGEDGLLTMEEILGLHLNADWVVLSACNSAAAGSSTGEAASGLGRAFFYAGAHSLLVTQWAVETESARLLTTDLFRRTTATPGLSKSQALQQAELALMEKSAGQDYSYAHPMFWAPFALMGAGD